MEMYRGEIIALIKQSFKAREANLEKLEWTTSLSSFSLGLEASKVRIEDGRELKKGEIEKLRVSIQPLKLIFGKIPVRTEVTDAHLWLRDEKAGDESLADDQKTQSTWAARLRHSLRLTLRLEGVQIERGSNFRLSKLEGDLLVSGWPGRFSGEFTTSSDLRLNNTNSLIEGQVGLNIDGYFQLQDGVALGAKLEEFQVDLGRARIKAGDYIEKSSGIPMELNSNLQLYLDPQGRVRGLELSRAKLYYDKVGIDIGATYNEDKGGMLRWNLVRTELDAFRFPLVKLNHEGLRGLIESSGSFYFYNNAPSSGEWKLSVNNLIVPAKTLTGPQEKLSSGHVTVSLITEGALQEGRFSSPHTEFQLAGTGAQISLLEGSFVKPVAHPLNILVKATIQNDEMRFSNVTAKLHSLDLRGEGEIKDFSKLFASDGSAQLKMSLHSNRIELTDWTNYFQAFRKAPTLEGFVEVAGSVEGPLNATRGDWQGLSWRIDRAHAANVNGQLYRDSVPVAESEAQHWSLSGPFSGNFLFQGRGVGSRIDRGTLLSQIDLGKMALSYRDHFRKAAGVPFLIDVSAEQSRNQINIRRGRFLFHTLDLGVSGQIVQGSKRGSLALAMARPVHLSDWKDIFVQNRGLPLEGEILWNGRLAFEQSGTMESDLDWRDLSLDGSLSVQRLHGRFLSLKNPIRGGQGKVIFSARGVTVPQFAFSLGGSDLSLSGEITAITQGRSKKHMTLAQLISQKKWDVSSQLSMTRLNSDDFAFLSDEKIPENRSENIRQPWAPTLKKWLSSNLVKESRALVALRIGQGEFGQLSYRQLNLRTLWENHGLKMQPFSLQSLGGKVSGTLSVDAKPFYQRQDLPLVSGSLKLDGIDLRASAKDLRPDLEKLIGGSLSGSINIVSTGFEPEDLIAQAQGRVEGRIHNGSLEILESMREPLDRFFNDSPLKDYLLGQSKKEKCLQKTFSGNIDAQIKNSAIEIQNSQFNFAAGSSLLMKGSLGQDSSLKLAGIFAASPECIGGKVRACLANGTGRAEIPFVIRGVSSQPEVSLDTSSLITKATSCMARSIAEKAKENLSSGGALDALGKSAAEKLKKIFK